jgi:hypothetical protein
MPSLQLHDLTVSELVKAWDSERQALKRRTMLRVVRDEQDLASAT